MNPATPIPSPEAADTDPAARSFCDALNALVETVDDRYHGTGQAGQRDFVARARLGLTAPGLVLLAARHSFARLAAFGRLFWMLPDDAQVLMLANGTPLEWEAHVVAALARMPVSRLLSGSMLDPDWSRLMGAIEGCSSAYDRVRLVRGATSFAAMCEATIDLPPGAVVLLDNLHLVHHAPGITALARDLRELAMGQGLTIVAGVGLAHWVDVRADKRPALSDLSTYCPGLEHIADRTVLIELVSDPDALVEAQHVTVSATAYGGMSSVPHHIDQLGTENPVWAINLWKQQVQPEANGESA